MRVHVCMGLHTKCMGHGIQYVSHRKMKQDSTTSSTVVLPETGGNATLFDSRRSIPVDPTGRFAAVGSCGFSVDRIFSLFHAYARKNNM